MNPAKTLGESVCQRLGGLGLVDLTRVPGQDVLVVKAGEGPVFHVDVDNNGAYLAWVQDAWVLDLVFWFRAKRPDFLQSTLFDGLRWCPENEHLQTWGSQTLDDAARDVRRLILAVVKLSAIHDFIVEWGGRMKFAEADEHGRPQAVAPVINDGKKASHPAYATIGCGRVNSGKGVYLFGSDFRHHNTMRIVISRGTVTRDLSHDWVHGGRELVEVELSEAQWATFVSTPNMGSWTPCTLRFRAVPDPDDILGAQPGIAAVEDRRAQLRGEVQDTLADTLAAIDEALRVVDGVEKMGARARTAITNALQQARQEVQANLPFVAKSFDEHAERTVERAKVEVNAYLTSAVMRAGLEALQGGAPKPIELAGGDDPEGRE